jgi:type II secretory pathway pseudopilin PulG
MTLHRRTRRKHDENGFTLVELLIALTISILIIGPISGAVIIGLRTTDTSSLRLSQTRDIELVQGILPRDVLSATTVQANVDATATASCANTASLLKMTWQTWTLSTASSPPTTSAPQNYEVDYYYTATVPATVPATGSLVRMVCTGGVNTSKVLATSLSASSAQQFAAASGGNVTLTLTDSSCARFSASAQQRATTTTDVTTTTTTTTFPTCVG